MDSEEALESDLGLALAWAWESDLEEALGLALASASEPGLAWELGLELGSDSDSLSGRGYLNRGRLDAALRQRILAASPHCYHRRQ